MDNPASVSEYIPVVTAIDASHVPFGFNISYSVATIDSSRISYGGRASLRVVDVEICDEFGNPLDLPENAYVDLVFRIYYSD